MRYNDSMSKPNLTLEKYQDAVWDFMLQHSDVTDRGAFFIKFHASDRADFEKRVRARAIHGYHRMDTRTNETHIQKENRAKLVRVVSIHTKQVKREKWKATREEKRRILEEVRLKNERRRQWGKLFPVIEYMHTLYTTLTRRKNTHEKE